MTIYDTQSQAARAASLAAVHAGIRLMLADDHRMLREGLRRSMAEQGFDMVGEARDGAEAVELARVLQPDVILMDINLPGMSGLDALKILKEWPETKDIPVIALTAAASERDRQRGERAGFYRYITKPVRVDELERALEAVLHDDLPRSS